MDFLNINYTVFSLISSSFKDFNFLIASKINGIGKIEKTIIFVDSVKKVIALGIYLRTLLLDNLKDRRNDIIKSFSTVLKTKTEIN